MPLITFLVSDGRQIAVDARVGVSVMEAAVGSRVAGIMAECGGSCMCATCHVYVEGGPVEALPPISSDEDAMLDDGAATRTEASRLSCQIKVRPELDGLIMRVAANI